MTTRTSSSRNAAFDRLGGFDGLDQGVQRLFARLAADPELRPLLPASGSDDLRWQTQLLLTDRLGGPMAYDGPDPATVRERAGVDAARANRIASHLLTAFLEVGAAPEAVEDLRAVLEEFARSLGIGLGTPAPESVAPPRDRRAELVAAAGESDRALFVLDPDLVLVHLNAEAERGVRNAESELRRAFALGAKDLPSGSILRIHPAPSQLQALLHDTARLPKETTWCFGRAVWKARLDAVRNAAGATLGYTIAWRDESESHRAQAVFERLRAQAEDLPVPIMYPDAMIERWYGNAACEHALQRLGPYLPYPVNPMEGVPVELFLPDESERRALFRDPARLPYKTQLRMGPETIAVLVSPVLDQNQHYLGPQITWEIVHFTRPEDRAAAERPPVGAPRPAIPPSAPAPVTAPASDATARPAAAIRSEARALESAAAELQTLVRLLDVVADQAEGQGSAAAVARAAGAESGAAAQAEAAIAAALVAVQRAADDATGELLAETRQFSTGLHQRVRETIEATQRSADGLGRILSAATGLSDLRTAFDEPAPPAPRRGGGAG